MVFPSDVIMNSMHVDNVSEVFPLFSLSSIIVIPILPLFWLFSDTFVDLIHSQELE